MKPWMRRRKREKKRKGRKNKRKSIKIYHNLTLKWETKLQSTSEMRRLTIDEKTKFSPASRSTTPQEEDRISN